ncbi:MAG: PLP-dependent transferase [Planctomycetes bacterium]|nr:PLP-dependent transferase [Planctomycetota bacterium]
MSTGFNTRAIHLGQEPDAQSGAVIPPIYQTSTYGQTEVGGDPTYCYSRTGNPTREALEKNIAGLENAKHGLCFASGMSAINNVLNLLSAGDHVVACNDLYGGAYRIFTKLYAKFGIEFTFVDATQPTNIRTALRKNTRIVWLETPSNPLLRITDIRACASIAREAGALCVVDNTFATPYLQNALQLGADIVVHSTTKYLNGHSDVLGGAVVVDSDDLHQQLRFFQNTVGAVPGPQDCFLIQRGIKTLALRMRQHCASAKQIAKTLAQHPNVEHVYFPGLSDHPQHQIAISQMNDFGGIVSFNLRGGLRAVEKFAANAGLWTLAESLGGVCSLWCHPPTMTHAAVEREVRLKNGLGDGLIRLSVGLEDIDDLLADLTKALDSAGKEIADTPAREGVLV